MRQPSTLDAETLIAGYEARKPRFTERDFMQRYTEIANARPIGIAGEVSGARPSDRVIALLASGSGTVAGEIVASSFLGERSHYQVRIAGRGEPVLIAASGAAPQGSVMLGWAPEDLIALPFTD